jgi:Ala-tRNA(Pro) deacylase
MSLAAKVEHWLGARGVDFDLVSHPRAPSGMRVAEAAHVSGDALVKGVLLEDEQGYVLALLPATRQLELGWVRRELGRPLGLATESEVSDVFNDCEPGAVPAVGGAYGLQTLVDKSLNGKPDVYFEAGDHEALVHVSGAGFGQLMKGERQGSFSRHV